MVPGPIRCAGFTDCAGSFAPVSAVESRDPAPYLPIGLRTLASSHTGGSFDRFVRASVTEDSSLERSLVTWPTSEWRRYPASGSERLPCHVKAVCVILYACTNHRDLSPPRRTSSIESAAFSASLQYSACHQAGIAGGFAAGRRNSPPEAVDGEHQHAVEVEMRKPGEWGVSERSLRNAATGLAPPATDCVPPSWRYSRPSPDWRGVSGDPSARRASPSGDRGRVRTRPAESAAGARGRARHGSGGGASHGASP
jgi:hypothetical protein